MVIRRDFLQVNGRRLARGLCAIGLSAALAACGNGTSPGDAAVDVREDGDFNFPRSAFCARLEDSGYRYGFQSYCRLGAAEGERCKFDPTIDTSASGYCASVTASTGGAFAAYDRNHRVPKICVLNEPNAPAWCPQYGEGQPVDAPSNNCVPEAQAQCVRFYPPDSGFRWACVPYHCD
jgi:hypothetical protein